MFRFKRTSRLPLIVWMAIAIYSVEGALAQKTGVVPNRVTAAIDANRTVTVKGSTTPLIAQSTDIGRMQADHNLGQMLLMLSPTAQQKAEFDLLIRDLHSPNSPKYHKWLTPQQVGEKFGISEDDAAQVQQWLQSQGLKVHKVANSRRFISFSGTVAQVERALRTEMHQYSYKGQEFIANSKDVQIPAALEAVVRGVVRLSSTPKSPNLKIVGKADYDESKQQITFADGMHAITPADFATIYNLNPLYQAGINGSGQTIAIVARSRFDPSDISLFAWIFGVPWSHRGGLNINGDDPGAIPGDDLETTLDTSWAIAVAPGATVWTMISQSNFADGIDVSAAYVVDNNMAQIMSTSYSLCEQNLGPVGTEFYYSIWAQAAAEGITAIVSSDDSGGAGCDQPGSGLFAQNGLAVNGMASTPFNVAVGGTQFDDTADPSQYWSTTSDPRTKASALSYIPEKVWNESSVDASTVNLFAGGGGVSTLWPKPDWQIGTGVPDDGMRDLPDVSFNAASHDGYVLCYARSCANGSMYILSGTSASAPAFAGLMALVNQQTGSAQGNPNYVLYQLAVQHPEIFHDVTAGDNKVPDQHGNFTVGYDAGPGYDLATGLGSVDGTALVTNWNSVQFDSTTVTLSGPGSDASFVHGTGIPLTATVTAGSGTPTGLVAFSTENPSSQSQLPFPALALGAGTLDNSGNVNITLTAIPGGTHNVTARYAGDAKYSAAASNSIAVTVTPEPSTAQMMAYVGGSLIQSANATYGDDIIIAVLIQGQSRVGHPTGSVTVAEGSTVYATRILNFGEHEIEGLEDHQGASSVFLLSGPGAGTHSITASYLGDPSFAASTSDPLQLIIKKSDATAVLAFQGSLLANTPIPTFGQVSLSSGALLPISGTVTLTAISESNSVDLGSVSLDPTTGMFSTHVIFPSPGTWTVTASYGGDANVNGTQAVQQVRVDTSQATTLALATTATNAAAGTPIVLTARVSSTVTSQKPTGTVTFIDGSNSLGTATLDSSGLATLTAGNLSGGVHSITASYGGDAQFRSSSASLTVSITDFTLQAGATSLNIPLGQSANASFTVIPLGGFSQPTQFSCSGLPNGASCSFAPASVTPDGSNPVSSTMTISTTSTSAMLIPQPRRSGMGWLALSGLGFVAIVSFGGDRRKRAGALVIVALALSIGLIACGGGSSTTPPPPAPNPMLGTYTVTVTSTPAVGTAHSTTLTVSIIE